MFVKSSNKSSIKSVDQPLLNSLYPYEEPDRRLLKYTR